MTRHEDRRQVRSPHALLPVPRKAVLVSSADVADYQQRVDAARERLREFARQGDCRPLDASLSTIAGA